MSNKYYIFSDESGSWANPQDKFYIRSWIKIREEDYLRLIGLWAQKKYPMPTKDTLLKNSNNIVDELNKIEFRYFFTFTKIDEFYNRKIYVRDTIIQSVSTALSQLETNIKNYMKEKIPRKIENAINQILFLNIYESFHIENALKNLCYSEETYELYLDKPQFTENDYLEIFNIRLDQKGLKDNARLIFTRKKNNGDHLGIFYADALASLSIKLLQENANSKIVEFFKRNILPKSLPGNIGIKGFNKVFYPVSRSYGNDNLQLEESHLINVLNEKLG